MMLTYDAPLIVAATAERSRASELAAAGVDRVIAYHSSVYRSQGLPSVAGLLPWDSANRQVEQMLPSVVQGAGRERVLATVCANDGLLAMVPMLERICLSGAVGVLNAPTVGLFTGPVRQVLEDTGLGMRSELLLVREAVSRGLEAWAYVFDEVWVEGAVEAGASALVVHLGITGFGASDPQRAAEQVERWLQPALGAGVPVLLHGGLLQRPCDGAAVLSHLGDPVRQLIAGFFGASAFERRQDADSTTTRDVVHQWRSVFAERRTPTPQ